MYFLLGYSQLNGLDFGDNIEYVMTRLVEWNTDYVSKVVCNYRPMPSETKSEAA